MTLFRHNDTEALSAAISVAHVWELFVLFKALQGGVKKLKIFGIEPYQIESRTVNLTTTLNILADILSWSEGAEDTDLDEATKGNEPDVKDLNNSNTFDGISISDHGEAMQPKRIEKQKKLLFMIWYPFLFVFDPLINLWSLIRFNVKAYLNRIFIHFNRGKFYREYYQPNYLINLSEYGSYYGELEHARIALTNPGYLYRGTRRVQRIFNKKGIMKFAIPVSDKPTFFHRSGILSRNELEEYSAQITRLQQQFLAQFDQQIIAKVEENLTFIGDAVSETGKQLTAEITGMGKRGLHLYVHGEDKKNMGRVRVITSKKRLAAYLLQDQFTHAAALQGRNKGTGFFYLTIDHYCQFFGIDSFFDLFEGRAQELIAKRDLVVTKIESIKDELRRSLSAEVAALKKRYKSISTHVEIAYVRRLVADYNNPPGANYTTPGNGRAHSSIHPAASVPSPNGDRFMLAREVSERLGMDLAELADDMNQGFRTLLEIRESAERSAGLTGVKYAEFSLGRVAVKRPQHDTRPYIFKNALKQYHQDREDALRQFVSDSYDYRVTQRAADKQEILKRITKLSDAHLEQQDSPLQLSTYLTLEEYMGTYPDEVFERFSALVKSKFSYKADSTVWSVQEKEYLRNARQDEAEVIDAFKTRVEQVDGNSEYRGRKLLDPLESSLDQAAQQIKDRISQASNLTELWLLYEKLNSYPKWLECVSTTKESQADAIGVEGPLVYVDGFFSVDLEDYYKKLQGYAVTERERQDEIEKKLNSHRERLSDDISNRCAALLQTAVDDVIHEIEEHENDLGQLLYFQRFLAEGIWPAIIPGVGYPFFRQPLFQRPQNQKALIELTNLAPQVAKALKKRLQPLWPTELAALRASILSKVRDANGRLDAISALDQHYRYGHGVDTKAGYDPYSYRRLGFATCLLEDTDYTGLVEKIKETQADVQKALSDAFEESIDSVGKSVIEKIEQTEKIKELMIAYAETGYVRLVHFFFGESKASLFRVNYKLAKLPGAGQRNCKTKQVLELIEDAAKKRITAHLEEKYASINIEENLIKVIDSIQAQRCQREHDDETGKIKDGSLPPLGGDPSFAESLLPEQEGANLWISYYELNLLAIVRGDVVVVNCSADIDAMKQAHRNLINTISSSTVTIDELDVLEAQLDGSIEAVDDSVQRLLKRRLSFYSDVLLREFKTSAEVPTESKLYGSAQFTHAFVLYRLNATEDLIVKLKDRRNDL